MEGKGLVQTSFTLSLIIKGEVLFHVILTVSLFYCSGGKTDPDLDICFGGRRKYCGGSYVDFGW